MARTKVVIVYSPNQARCRTVILPHDDADLAPHLFNLTKGEAVLVGSFSEYQAIGPFAMLANYLGRHPTETDRCAVVDEDGFIREIISGDPSIDKRLRHTVILDHQGIAEVGKHAREVGLIP